MAKSSPYIFDEFFAAGLEESISPFLTRGSRRWGRNLPLKVALVSALLLAISFSFSFTHPQLSNLFLLGVYFFSGTPALIGSLEDLKNLEINIDVLMTLAALLSVAIGSGLEGALLLVLFEFSGAMEMAVAHKTKSALLTLNELSPRTASVVEEGGVLVERSVKEIALDTKLLIKAGEVIPLDGVVIEGGSMLNLAHLTGESQPIPKNVGDEVPAGARNLEGSLTIRVTRMSHDSTIARIIQLITEATHAKPKVERFLNQFGKWYSLTIMCLSLVFAITLPFVFHLPFLGIEGALYRSLAFLVAASPCALIIATPTAYLSALSACAKKGILLKGGIILDAIAKCRLFAFDKTGTLTTGALRCIEITALRGNTYTLDEAMQTAFSLERNAVHPIATAICEKASQMQLTPLPLDNFRSIAGMGLQALVQIRGKSSSASIGHADFIPNIPPSERKEGILATYLLINDDLFGFTFADEVRPQAVDAISRLKKQGYEVTMLTGDHPTNAAYIANELGINTYFADLRPEDKVRKVEELSSKENLIMIGDGINDAPALKRATCGISMGKIASATAVDASDVVCLQDDLSLIPWVKDKALKTSRILRQNLSLALGVILFASTPALLGIVPLWAAVLLHEGGTVIVGLNSLRLLRK